MRDSIRCKSSIKLVNEIHATKLKGTNKPMAMPMATISMTMTCHDDDNQYTSLMSLHSFVVSTILKHHCGCKLTHI